MYSTSQKFGRTFQCTWMRKCLQTFDWYCSNKNISYSQPSFFPFLFTIYICAPILSTLSPPTLLNLPLLTTRRHSHSYLQAALYYLVDVQEGLLEQLELMSEYPDNSLPLQDKEPLGSVPTVHHSHRLPQTTQHLLGTVAVVFVFPG